MKINFLVKKLFVIVALGCFCAPAQAMWQCAWDYVKSYVVSTKKNPIAEYLLTKDIGGGSGGSSRYSGATCSFLVKSFNLHEFDKLCRVHSEDINTKDNAGKTPLDYALDVNNREVCMILLKYGADIKIH